MSDDLVVKGHVIKASELEERFETTGGPGGQHANRNETGVRLRFRVAGSSLPDEVKQRVTKRLGDPVEVVAADERSQARNRAVARERLIARLETALEEQKPRRRTRPTRRSKEERLAVKRRRSDLKRTRRQVEPED